MDDVKVYKCIENSSFYGIPKDSYVLFDTKLCIFPKNYYESAAVELPEEAIRKDFVEVSYLFKKLQKGKTIFIVPPEKIGQFLFVLRYVMDGACDVETLGLQCDYPIAVYKCMDSDESFYVAEAKDLSVIPSQEVAGSIPAMIHFFLVFYILKGAYV